MAKLDSFTSIEFESFIFSSFFKPSSTTKTLVLAGAGARRVEVQENIMQVDVSSVYLEEKAIELLIVKWKGKTDVELLDSHEFFDEIYNGKSSLILELSSIVNEFAYSV
nr:chalcone isomerase [Tanacetum cinerariifolium]